MKREWKEGDRVKWAYNKKRHFTHRTVSKRALKDSGAVVVEQQDQYSTTYPLVTDSRDLYWMPPL